MMSGMFTLAYRRCIDMRIVKTCRYIAITPYKQVWNLIPTIVFTKQIEHGTMHYIVAVKFLCFHLGVMFTFEE